MAAVASERQNLLSGSRIELWSFYHCQTGTREPHYADEVPSENKMYKFLSIMGCIFSTPIALLCCIPIIRSLKKVHVCLFSCLYTYIVNIHYIISFSLIYVPGMGLV